MFESDVGSGMGNEIPQSLICELHILHSFNIVQVLYYCVIQYSQLFKMHIKKKKTVPHNVLSGFDTPENLVSSS